jgi:cytosine/adenosine deaminase-related metal-dependent hydrolase
VAGPPLANGTVTVRGDRIESVDPRGTRTPDEDLGNAAIIPGLVNAHTHLDLSGARGLVPPTDPDHFTDWLRGVIAYRKSRTPEQVQTDIRAGLAEAMQFGTTLIGDIAAEGVSWEPLAASRVRAVVFYEMIGATADGANAAMDRTKAWLDSHPDTPTCRSAVSPHAPYSVFAPLYSMAWVWKRIMATHLAESPAEDVFVRTRSGPLAELLRELGIDPAKTATLPGVGNYPGVMGRPSRVVLAHCNYLSPEAKFSLNQTVAYCPRTHAAFGHLPHPFREFIRRGVRVCLATDSLASNPDLDVLAEARFVHAACPGYPTWVVLHMVTLGGAEALGWADEAGSLEPGKSADLVVVPLPDREASNPHDLLLADHPGDRQTMFRGKWRA